MADEARAKRLFQQNDIDQNGVLDARELRKVVRELATASGVNLTMVQVQAEVAKCLGSFGSKRGVTEEGFQRYAASEPSAFGALFVWREVFSRYASARDEIQGADAVKLVMDVCSVNTHAITPERADAEAVELMKTADVMRRGSVNFCEFVSYAREREALFGPLSHQVMKDVGGEARNTPAAGASASPKAEGLLDKAAAIDICVEILLANAGQGRVLSLRALLRCGRVSRRWWEAVLAALPTLRAVDFRGCETRITGPACCGNRRRGLQ